MRDARINLIFEGSSEIMHLFMAREAVDRHLRVAGPLVFGRSSQREKIRALPRIAAFYALWYPSRWLGWSFWPRFREFGPLAKHMRFVERSSRRLARTTFHGMLVYRAGMQKKEAFLFRVVDIAMQLFAMAATVSRAHKMAVEGNPAAREARELADFFCWTSRRQIRRTFRDLWYNDDAMRYRVGRDVLEGRHAWLEEGSIGLGYGVDDLRPAGIKHPAHASGAESVPEEPSGPPPTAPYS